MSDSLAGLRRKLDAAKQLGSVVRAMKGISASSIVQYEKAVDALGQYQRSVELSLSLCLGDEQPLTARPANGGGKPSGALVFGTDQGLVGRLNEVIGDSAAETLRKIPGPKTVWAVGDRVCPLLEAAGLTVRKRFMVPSSVAAITALVTEIQIEIEEFTVGNRYAEVHVFHNSPGTGRALRGREPASVTAGCGLASAPQGHLMAQCPTGADARRPYLGPGRPDTRTAVHFPVPDVRGIPGE